GFPLTAGFYSKDAIIESAYATERAGHVFAYLCTTIAALLTSFYSWRLIFMTFFGEARWAADAHGAHGDGAAHDEHATHGDDDHAHHGPLEPRESPLVMLVPLAVLAIGAICAGFAFKHLFFGSGAEHFWGKGLVFSEEIVEKMEAAPIIVKYGATVLMLVGLGLAWWFYIVNPSLPVRLAEANPILYRFLLNKW